MKFAYSARDIDNTVYNPGQNNSDSMRMLVEASTDIMAIDERGWTVLHHLVGSLDSLAEYFNTWPARVAAKETVLFCIDFAVRQGADAEVRDKRGKRAVDLFATEGRCRRYHEEDVRERARLRECLKECSGFH